MKKNILIILVFISSMLFSQTQTKKYNTYNQRYEYFDAYGNMIAYEKYNSYSKQWEYYELNKSKSSPYQYRDPEELDISALGNALRIKQRQYDIAIQQAQNQQAEAERINREKAVVLKQQIDNYYNSFSSYPKTISNGWYNVYVTNNYDFTEERKVYVENNIITKYVIDNWLHRSISTSFPILNGKTNIKITYQNESSLLTIYFLEAIANPNVYTTPPLNSGKITFWTNFNKDYIKIYVEGDYIGTLKSNFSSESGPNCGQDSGTVIFESKPGTYNYTAKSSNYSWNGTITVTENGCSKMRLNK